MSEGAVSGAADGVSTATLQTLSMFGLPTGGTSPLLNLPGANDPMGAGSCGVGVEAMPGGWNLAGSGVPPAEMVADAGGTGAAALLQESLVGGVGGGGVGLGLMASASAGELHFGGGGGGPLLARGQFASWPSAMDTHLFLQTAAGGGGGELGCGLPFDGQMTMEQQLQLKNLDSGGGGNSSSSQDLLPRRPPRH